MRGHIKDCVKCNVSDKTFLGNLKMNINDKSVYFYQEKLMMYVDTIASDIHELWRELWKKDLMKFPGVPVIIVRYGENLNTSWSNLMVDENRSATLDIAMVALKCIVMKMTRENSSILIHDKLWSVNVPRMGVTRSYGLLMEAEKDIYRQIYDVAWDHHMLARMLMFIENDKDIGSDTIMNRSVNV